METLFTKQLLAFLETSNCLFDHQYGFQQARATGDFLSYAVHAWFSALESYSESRVTLDISKPFDRFWHKVLFAQLSMLGLHPNRIAWISTFLSGRSMQSEFIASFVSLIISTQIYLRALLPLLFYLSSS